MLFDACCATQGFCEHMCNGSYDWDFKSERSDSEHSALSDEDVVHYGSKKERDGYGRWHKINRETSLCKGPCGRELPRHLCFKLDAHRHRDKVCWQCHFIQDLRTCKGLCKQVWPSSSFDKNSRGNYYKRCRNCQYPRCTLCGKRRKTMWPPNKKARDPVLLCEACENKKKKIKT